MSLRPADPDDICRWPDGSWCYRYELIDYHWMSDDYEVIPFEAPEWELLNSSDQALAHL